MLSTWFFNRWTFSIVGLYNLDAQKRHYFYLCVLAGLLFFPALGARDFWAPVEPRYAEIVRIMFAKGEWMALLVGKYIDDLASGSLVQDRLYRGLALFFFNSLWLGCLALPVAAWVVFIEAFRPSLPLALTTACGGFAAAYFVRHGSPWKVFLAATLTMLFATLTASFWLMPFLERYKSPRPFALEVKKHIPPAAQLFVYADTMNDYNFYLERTVIPVVASQAETQMLLVQAEPAYIMVRDRDLKKLKWITRERIVLKAGARERAWYLIALGGRTKP